MNSKVIALLIVMSFLALKFNSVQGMRQGDQLLLLLYKGNILSSVPDSQPKTSAAIGKWMWKTR